MKGFKCLGARAGWRAWVIVWACGFVPHLVSYQARAETSRVGSAVGHLLAFRDEIDRKFQSRDAESLAALENAFASGVLKLRDEFGRDLWLAALELSDRTGSDHADDIDFSLTLVAHVFPLYPREAARPLATMIENPHSVLYGPYEHYVKAGVQVLEKLSVKSLQLACSVFEKLQRSPSLSSMTLSKAQLVTPLAIRCPGGADFVMSMMQRDPAFRLDFDSWMRIPVTEDFERLLGWFIHARGQDFADFMVRIESQGAEKTAELLKIKCVRDAIHRVVNEGSDGVRMASYLVLYTAINDMPNLPDDLLRAAVTRMPLDEHRFFFVNELFRERPKSPAQKLGLKLEQKEWVVKEVLDVWDKMALDHRSGAITAPLTASFIRCLVALKKESPAFQKWLQDYRKSIMPDETMAMDDSRLRIRELVLLADLEDHWSRYSSSREEAMAALRFLEESLKSEPLRLREWALRYFSIRSFAEKLNDSDQSAFAKIFEPAFKNPRPEEIRLRLQMLALVETSEEFRRVLRMAFVDPSLSVRLAAKEKMDSFGCLRRAAKNQEEKDSLDSFYFGLRDSLRLPGLTPEPLIPELEFVFLNIEDDMKVQDAEGAVRDDQNLWSNSREEGAQRDGGFEVAKQF